MSFPIFKQNMLLFMNNQEAISSYGDFAKKLTLEYDALIRRGFQTVNNVTIATSNMQLMETLVNAACAQELAKQSGNSGILDGIGRAVIGYWTGATLVNFPPPIIPATGAVYNLATTTASVLNPGTWPTLGPAAPTLDSGTFLDLLIAAMQIHLTSLSGMYITISVYPGWPAVPAAPGVVLWNGYTIP